MPTHPTPTLALVTGASTGIGRELARQLAAEGAQVLAVADEAAVHDAAAAIGATPEVRSAGGGCTAVQADLATVAGVEQVVRAVAERAEPLEVLALNAGTGTHGTVVDNDVADDLRVVDLDVRAVVHLASLLVPGMVCRGRGGVLVTASIAAEAPGPYQATYAASKAFVQSYALALRHELRGTGVVVTSVRPGPVRTAFFRRAGMGDTLLAHGPQDDAADVARDALAALRAGRASAGVGSWVYQVPALAARVVPERLRAAVAALPVAPGSARRARRCRSAG